MKTYQVDLGVTTSWSRCKAVQNTRKFCLMCWLIFSCQGSRCFYKIRSDIVYFLFNFCFNFEFGCFNFATNSVVDTHILNMYFKRCGNIRNMTIVLNNLFLFLVYILYPIRDTVFMNWLLRYRKTTTLSSRW